MGQYAYPKNPRPLEEIAGEWSLDDLAPLQRALIDQTDEMTPAETRDHMIRTFVGYRPHPPEEYYEKGTANPPDDAQYEGCVFSDGTVVIRWLTSFRSHSIWADFETFMAVHGHPEYGTRIEWFDGPVARESTGDQVPGA